MRRTTAVLIFIALGCTPTKRPEPVPVAAPRVATSVRHLAGSPLAGDAGAVVSTGSPDEALQVVVAFVALRTLPETCLEPLADRARLIASATGRRALLPAPILLAGARAGTVLDATTFADSLDGGTNRFADRRGALPRGVTAVFEAMRDGARGPGGTANPERVAISVHRKDDDTLEAALEVELGNRDEIALLDIVRPGAGEGLVLAIRSPFEREEAGALAAIVSILAPPARDAPGASAHARAFAACEADLARSIVFTCRDRGLEPETVPARPDPGEALRTLRGTGERRQALFLVAQAAGSPSAEDVALAGDDRLVAAVAQGVLREVDAASVASFSWAVEKGALVGIKDSHAEGEASPYVKGLLLRRGGAAGTSLGTFFGVLEAAASAADFEDRLARENAAFLEDASPVSRVRAFDWLAARKRAPRGYDPLAPAEDRRNALENLDPE